MFYSKSCFILLPVLSGRPLLGLGVLLQSKVPHNMTKINKTDPIPVTAINKTKKRHTYSHKILIKSLSFF